MEKQEFLTQLQSELEGSLSEAEIREQIDFYGRYIEEEAIKGTSEAAVIDDLGDPWIIARTIIEKKERQTGETYHAEQTKAEQDAQTDKDYAHNQRTGGAFTYIMVLVVAILIIVAIIGTAVGALAFLYRNLPILFVIVIVLWIIHRIRN